MARKGKKFGGWKEKKDAKVCRRKPRRKKVAVDKNFKAVLIGINYRGTSAELSGCINDVRSIHAFIKKEFNPDPKNIHILTEDSKNPQNHPVKANILRELRWLCNVKTKKNTRLFLHYSGHGSYEYDRSGDEKDRRDENICPLDYKYRGFINDDTFRKICVNPIKNKKNVKMTVVLDCCHSGSGFDLHYNWRTVRHTFGKNSYKVLQNKHYPKTLCDITMFSGCRDKQTSADAYIRGKYQGAMTWAFLATIQEFKLSGRKLTYKKFITSLQELLRKKKYSQVPQLSTGHYLDFKSECIF